jgi:hypothetical protein
VRVIKLLLGRSPAAYLPMSFIPTPPEKLRSATELAGTGEPAGLVRIAK